ncbi:MAG: hypothetical protein ACOVP1_02175 [Bacteroidia bacterium]
MIRRLDLSKAKFFLFLILGFAGFFGELSASELANNIPSRLLATQKYETKGSFRIGVSTGMNLYVGNQMDYQITRNFGVINETKLGYGIGVYRSLNNNWEIGGVIKRASFASLKSNNTQGIMGNFNEFQINFQKSLNSNILIDVSSLTYNLQFGFGVFHYQSQYMYLDPRKQSVTQIASSVGYGYSGEGQFRASKFKNIPDKQIAFVGNLGFNIGYRLTGNLTAYFENVLSLTSTSKLSGNLLTTTTFPTDAMFYTGISLYANLGKKVGSFGRNSCPRWF